MHKGFERTDEKEKERTDDDELQRPLKNVFCFDHERKKNQSRADGENLLREVFAHVPEWMRGKEFFSYN